MELENLPRHQQSNPFNYTKVQLAQRKKAIKDMIKDYPTVCPMWCEWIYDFGQYTPPEEIERIINSGEWEKPGKFSKPLGGILTDNIEITDSDGNFIKV
jgi:hypothetical protein